VDVHSDHVVIKEISWDLVTVNGPTLAENPIKEVAAMQYLQAFVRNERLLRRRRRGNDCDDDSMTMKMTMAATWASNDLGEAMEDEERVFFFLLLFCGFPRCSFFSESNASRETVPVSVFLQSHEFSTWQITPKFLLGNQVQNLVAKFELGSRYRQN
jgi:hypothetical protein